MLFVAALVLICMMVMLAVQLEFGCTAAKHWPVGSSRERCGPGMTAASSQDADPNG